MPAKISPTRYAHSEGHTGLCFSENGNHIITCGSEGDVRIWTGLEDDDPIDKCVGEKALAVFQKGTQLYVGSDTNTVQVLTFPETEFNGLVTRFTAPVTHIDVSVDGKTVASGSSDMKINVTEIETNKNVTLSEHRAPILSVALDPKMEFLVSASCDGTVRIWKLSDQSVVQTWNCIPKSNSFAWSSTLCRISWQPVSGRLLAVPDKREINLYERDTWAKTISFTDPNPGDQIFSVTCFSMCGEFLAASTTQGHIYVWNVNGGQLVEKLQTLNKYHVCGLAWNPTLDKYQLAFCDVQGNLGTVEDLPCVRDSSTEKEGKQEQEVDDSNIPLANPVFVDSDDDDNDNAISLEKIKNESGFGADLGVEDDDKTSITGDMEGRVSRLSVTPALPPIELQPPFQPGSSPVHLQHRYMVWNDLGIVRQVNTEDENAIDVEFHDTSVHYPLRLNNAMNHSMAALSAEALVLACDKQDDAPSKLVCIMLNAWDGSKEWVAQMSEDEEILAVAAGKGWVAVATDTRTLRVFTVAGNQREVISLPGPVVCVCGKDDKLVAVFHSGIGLNGDQCLSYFVLRIGSCSRTLNTPSLTQVFPLSPKSTLRWLGFSDEGSLFSVDSAGSLRLLSSSMLWRPVCHLDERSKGKSDHYFVMGISERYQNIRCVLCKGAFYPPTIPKPALSEVPWQIPVCEFSIEKGELEEEFWRSQISLNSIESLSQYDESLVDAKDTIDKVIKKSIMKLFALACQSGLEMRAVELCEMMPSPQVVQLALKYASKLGKMQLAERISQVVKRKTQELLMPVPSEPNVYGFVNGYDDTCNGVQESVTNGHTSSQDMFVEEKTNTGQENLILAMKQKKAVSTPNSVLSGKAKRENPFKKPSETQGDTSRGLASLSKRPILTKNISKQAFPDLVKSKMISPKQDVKNPHTNENKTAKKNPFVEWFASQKTSLEEEFPDLDVSQLTKVAIKRFKEEKQKPAPAPSNSLKRFLSSSSVTSSDDNSQEDSQEIIESSQAPVDIKKRKLSPTESKGTQENKSANSKLKAFAFSKQ